MAHITFIHGIGNHPPNIEDNWIEALREGGLDVRSEGITTSMVYWSDVMYAEPPDEEKMCGMAGPGGSDVDAQEVLTETEVGDLDLFKGLDAKQMESVREFMTDLNCAPQSMHSSEETAEKEMNFGATFSLASGVKYAAELARDVFFYLTNVEYSPRDGVKARVQDRIRKLFVDQLMKDVAMRTGRHIVVSHSMGTVISYDCLKNVGACNKIDGYVTVGSPLGMDRLQDMLDGYSVENGFPRDKIAGSWVNIYDPIDLVSLRDQLLADDFMHDGAQLVTDVKVNNEPWWTHTAEKYLAQPALCDILRDMLL